MRLNPSTTLMAALTLAGGIAARAQAQTFNFAGPINSVAGTSVASANTNNVLITDAATVTAAYALGTTYDLHSGNLTSGGIGSFASEARIRLRNSGYPGLFCDIQPITTTGTFTVLGVVPALGRVMPTSTMVGATIAAGSVWSAEFFESFDDPSSNPAAPTMSDATWDTLSFTVPGAAPAPPVLAISLFAAGPINSTDALNDPDNTTVTLANTATVPITLGTSLITLAGTNIALQATGTLANHVRLRLTNSAFPTSANDISPFGTIASIPGPASLSVPAAISGAFSTPTGFTTLGGALIPVASNWSIQAYEATANGPDDLPEAVITNFSFGFGGTAFTIPIAQNFSLTGPLNIAGLPRNAGNSVASMGSVTASYVLGNTVVTTGSLTRPLTSASTFNIGMRLRNSAFPSLHVDLPVTGSLTGSVLNVLSGTRFLGNAANLGVISGAIGTMGSLVGLTIPAGSTWSGEFFTLNDLVTGVDWTVNSFNVSLTSGSAFVPNSFTSVVTSTVTDLGTININTAPISAPITFSVPSLAASEVMWFRFATTEALTPSGSSFIDAWLFNTAGTDMELGLFDSTGYLIAQDDDSGPGVLPQLSLGTALAPRPATPPGTLAAGIPFDGRWLEGLPAGTYYLSVSRFLTSHNGTAFHALGGTSLVTVPVIFSIRTNLPAGTTLTGNALLESIAVDTMSVRPLIIELFDSGGNPVGSPITTSVANDGAFSALMTAPSGTYTVKLSTQGSLRSAITSVTLSGGSVALPSAVTLRNGNVNADTEVGPADFSGVLSQFGNEGTPAFVSADLDRNGEVGSDDFSIILARFGAEDE